MKPAASKLALHLAWPFPPHLAIRLALHLAWPCAPPPGIHNGDAAVYGGGQPTNADLSFVAMERLRDSKKPPQSSSDVQREAEPPMAEQMRVVRRVADRILLAFAVEKEDGDVSAELL